MIRVKELLRTVPGARRMYRALHVHDLEVSLHRQGRRVGDWAAERMPGQGKLIRNFSLEYATIGRNDDHTPDWLLKLESTIVYNRSLFAGSGIDFRVAFVEWNPPQDRPLLAPYLVDKYPFLRAVVVDRNIHDDLCQLKSMNMLICFPFNAAIRSSEADFILASCAEDYLGTDVARWLVRRGLRKRCLYRAVRVDIRRDLDFLHADACALEGRQNAIRVSNADGAAYGDNPGDFILMDRVSMQRISGFDESVPRAAWGIDSRFCASAMSLGLGCRLIGHVYHIDHDTSTVYTGARGPLTWQDVMANLPYKNPETWGLRDRQWTKSGERLSHVS